MKLPLLLGGQADAFSRSPHQFIADLATEQGGLGRFRLYHRQAIAIADAELARQVLIRQVEVFQRGRHFRAFGLFLGDGLLSTDGDLWKPARQWLDPSFRHEPLAVAFPGIQAVIREELDRWQQLCQRGDGVLDLMPALKLLMARLITRTLFALLGWGTDRWLLRSYRRVDAAHTSANPQSAGCPQLVAGFAGRSRASLGTGLQSLARACLAADRWS
jgi:cytochrome P450